MYIVLTNELTNISNSNAEKCHLPVAGSTHPSRGVLGFSATGSLLHSHWAAETSHNKLWGLQ